jgi:hypothetical protein
MITDGSIWSDADLGAAVGNLIAVTFLLFIMRWAVLLTFVNGAMLRLYRGDGGGRGL